MFPPPLLPPLVEDKAQAPQSGGLWKRLPCLLARVTGALVSELTLTMQEREKTWCSFDVSLVEGVDSTWILPGVLGKGVETKRKIPLSLSNKERQ